MNTAIYQKRRDEIDARAVYQRLRAERILMEQEAARAKLKGLGPQQLKVLRQLQGIDWTDERYYTYRRQIEQQTGLTTLQVRRALRALQRLGFVEYGRGLWTEDGEPAGSGWRATAIGDTYGWPEPDPAPPGHC